MLSEISFWFVLQANAAKGLNAIMEGPPLRNSDLFYVMLKLRVIN
jgi:hypothetical protein